MAIEDEIALLTHLRTSELLFLQCNSYSIWLHLNFYHILPQTQSVTQYRCD